MASEPAKIHRTIRFGGKFEVDPVLCELRQSGKVLRLERIPMAILVLLIHERDRVVSRQEIADGVWGKEAHFDIDNSINGAIRKIRRVLRDDSDKPQFIQTVAGRGYRFIARVETEEPEAPVQPAIPIRETGSAAESAPVLLQGVDDRDSAAKSRLRSLQWWTGLAALTAVLIAAMFYVWHRRQARRDTAPEEVRLAVLPFQNLTGDANQDYFSDGFTAEMISQLGSLDPKRLAVIARTSVMHYKDAPMSLREIERDLNVQYVLEGSVRRDDRQVRITAQLIQASDQKDLWAREYNRPAQDTLAIQSEIALEIADEIQSTLGGRKPVTKTTRNSGSPQEYHAWDLYLQGRYWWNQRNEQGIRQAAEWFQRSVTADPDFAPGYAGLADSWALMSSYGYVQAKIYMPQARTAALKALQLDPLLAEAHTSLALIAENYDWDWPTAEREFRRAIELNPSYATAHQWLAECLSYEGRFGEALEESEIARRLDPLSLIIAADNGAIYYFARRYNEAEARFQSVLQIDPNFGRAHMILAVQVQQGHYREALADLQGWKRDGNDPWAYAMDALVYGRSGDPVRARAALRRLQDEIRTSPIDTAPLLSDAYAGVGDREKWLACLEQAVAQRSSLPTTFKVDPLFDPLRSDLRFQKMLRQAGFQP
ncbi:MAG: winged helix-turn-helix domain-containing protein [Acidobacteriaceae bacterium]